MQQKQQQKQQRQQHQNLLCQFIQLSIPMPRDAKGEIYVSIPIGSPRSEIYIEISIDISLWGPQVVPKSFFGGSKVHASNHYVRMLHFDLAIEHCRENILRVPFLIVRNVDNVDRRTDGIYGRTDGRTDGVYRRNSFRFGD